MSARLLCLLPVGLVACDPTSPWSSPVEPMAGEEDVPGDSLTPAPGEPRGMQPVLGPDGLTHELPPPLLAVKAPLAQAYCQINVNGVNRDTETDYLPHVIQCENGGANFEALKAQAIAARSVAYYAMATNGKICDGQGCQVYSCNANPQQIHYDAAAATAGQYLSFNGWLTYAFFVAGDSKTAPPGCVDTANNTDSATEQYVTFNNGKTLYDVDQTSLGFKFPEDVNVGGYGQNRGCMSQWGARCLENNNGAKSTDLIKFYYGADINIVQGEGPCVAPPNKPAKGFLDEVSCTQVRGWAFDEDSGAAPINAYISFNAPLGDPNAVALTTLASQQRDDLCGPLGSCEHGFTTGVPRSLLDNQPHPVHGYAVDPQADPVQLGGSPAQLLCPPPVLPQGVRRWIPSPEVLASWQFDPFWQMARLDDATLAAIPQWQNIPTSPQLMRIEGDPAIWMFDNGFRRHVPDPQTAVAWRLDLDTALVWQPEDLLMLPIGTPLRPEPFLLSAPGDPAIYILDDPQCTPEGDPNDPLCPPPPEPTTGASAGNDSFNASTPTEGGESGGGTSSGNGGSTSFGPGPDSAGQALPPGYGQNGEGGCAVAAPDRRGAGLLALVLLLVRRRRRK
jgi:MYXO-CTERM domain-containing protein